jgi:hypothetical protein
MNHIKYLEFQRLIRELQFVESDYLYQSEILKLSDSEFLNSVTGILDQFPDLKEIYYRRQNEIFEKMIVEPMSESIQSVEEEVQIEENLEAKKLYRDIVKTTHPDKIKNHKLNELYLQATEAYEKNDIVTLYKVCSELDIEFDLPDDYLYKIREKIESYKNQVSFLEKTYTFRWVKSNNDSEKNKILVEFIKSQIT